MEFETRLRAIEDRMTVLENRVSSGMAENRKILIWVLAGVIAVRLMVGRLMDPPVIIVKDPRNP